MRTKGGQVAVVLHNVRSVHNVGAIFRTADAAGVSHIYLTGYTPCPTDRFGRMRRGIAKTALGAEETMQWSYHRHLLDVCKLLRKEGWQVIGVEQTPEARDYRTFSKKHAPICFVFGNEVRGLSKQARKMCDRIVCIPMRGTKESLNVSVAAGIILFGVGLR